MKFKQFIELEDAPHGRLSVYECRKCGGQNAYNGDPIKGGVYKGSIKCFDCGNSWAGFTVEGKFLEPISRNGPPIKDIPLNLPFIKKTHG